MSIELNTTEVPDPEKWVEMFGDYLYAYAFYRTKNEKDAEDAVQDTFRRAWRYRESFKGRSQFKTWITGILRNVISEHFRKMQRRELESHPILDDLAEDESLAFHPSEALERKEFWDVLEHCLERLPPRTAQIFREREIEGLSSEEVAKRHEITTGNLFVLIHRARRDIRFCIIDFLTFRWGDNVKPLSRSSS